MEKSTFLKHSGSCHTDLFILTLISDISVSLGFHISLYTVGFTFERGLGIFGLVFFIHVMGDKRTYSIDCLYFLSEIPILKEVYEYC